MGPVVRAPCFVYGHLFASVFSSIVSGVCAMDVYCRARTAAAGDDGFITATVTVLGGQEQLKYMR